MNLCNKILNEEDPFIREIMALGYPNVMSSVCENTITFFNDKQSKTFDTHELQQFSLGLTIKEAILIDGRVHRWVSEADGSADRFRNYIMNGKSN